MGTDLASSARSEGCGSSLGDLIALSTSASQMENFGICSLHGGIPFIRFLLVHMLLWISGYFMQADLLDSHQPDLHIFRGVRGVSAMQSYVFLPASWADQSISVSGAACGMAVS